MAKAVFDERLELYCEGDTDSVRKKRFLASQHVRAALEILDGLSIPQNAHDGAWLAAKKELVAHGQSVFGYVLLRERKTQEAVSHLEQAASLDPQSIYFYRCALAYMLLDRRREAAEAFEKARKFGPATVSRASDIRLNNLSLDRDR